MNGKLIQINEASKILGVSKLTLRNWDKSGKLVAYRHPINNYRVYKSEDIEQILKQFDIIPKPSYVAKKNKVDPKGKTYTLKVLHVKD